MSELVFSGLLPASVLPVDEQEQIDEAELRTLIRFLLSVQGVGGIVCNGHAGDVWALTRAQKRRVIEVHVDEARGRLPIIAGVDANSTREALELAADARDAGAAGVLVLPPSGMRAPNHDVAVAYFEDLARGVDIAIIAFQYPKMSPQAYAPTTLARLAEISNVVAVKDAAWDIKAFEADAVALKGAPRRVAHLNALDTMLLAGFLFTTDGSLIGFGNLVPHWVLEMLDAMRRRDLDTARAVNDRLYPLVDVLYQTPGLPTHAAIKEALYMVGVLNKPSLSPRPTRALNDNDRAHLRQALEESGLAAFYAKRGAREPVGAHA
jgi:4-hydroxy-tetrahydrodipicolinate synthase